MKILKEKKKDHDTNSDIFQAYLWNKICKLDKTSHGITDITAITVITVGNYNKCVSKCTAENKWLP